MIARRTLLKAAAALGMARFAVAQESAVPVLTAQRISAKLVPDAQSSSLWSYGADWPPPILRARQGEEFRVRFVNTLDRAITVHWFGVRGPAEMMSLTVQPGDANALDCVFTPPDAGTFWFGPISEVSRQREMGLYGMLIVAESNSLELPDLPVIIDDWRLTDDGLIDEQSFGSLDDAIGQGRLGNWITANGVYRPRLKAPQGPFRMRVLNAANVRPMPLTFKGTDPRVIALDGQPVMTGDIGASALQLSPGQRVDLLFPEGNGDIGLGLDLFEDQVELAYVSREGSGGSIGENFALPANPLPLFSADTAKTVRLVIEGGEKGGLRSAMLNGERLELRTLLEKGYAWALNGVAGLGAEPWQVFDKGSSVMIEADNRTAFEQPLCIHGHVWQELDTSAPWRDTVLIPPRGKARLGFVADNPGTWGLHSLIAERLDAGLFTSFAIR